MHRSFMRESGAQRGGRMNFYQCEHWKKRSLCALMDFEGTWRRLDKVDEALLII
jgi:hypothetical protein